MNANDDVRLALKKANRYRARGELEKAIRLCEQLVVRFPTYMGALHTLGLLYTDRKEYPKALGFLVRAVLLNPRDWRVLVALSDVYLQLGGVEPALRALREAARIEPEEAAISLALGRVYYRKCEFEKAERALRKALSIDPSVWEADLLLGQTLLQLGRPEEGAEVLKRVNRRKPRLVSPLLWLAGLPSAYVKEDLLARLDRTKRAPDEDPEDFESSLAFARANVLDRLGEHDRAWNELLRANRIMKAGLKAELVATRYVQDKILKDVRSRTFSIRKGGGGRGKGVVSLYILGPSRSGKSTLEKLLAASGHVKAGYENPMPEEVLRCAMLSDGYMESRYYGDLPQKSHATCRKYYLQELAEISEGKSVMTITHPGYISSVGHIASIVPNVRIVFMKRNIPDNMLRIFMKKYAEAFSNAYDLGEIYDYMMWYHELIDILHERLKEISIVVNYEDMVTDTPSVLARISDLCGVDFACGQTAHAGDVGCAGPYMRYLEEALGSRIRNA